MRRYWRSAVNLYANTVKMSLLVSLLFKLYIITTLVAKCRIDSFMLRGTGSLCHMFFKMLHSVMRVSFGFPMSLFDRLAFSIPFFCHFQCWHGRTEYWKLPAFFTKHSKCCVTNSWCWQCLCTLLFRYFIGSYYNAHIGNLSLYPPLYWPNLQRSSMRNLHQLSFSQNCPRKHVCFDAVVFHLSIKGFAKHDRIVLTAFCQCSSFIVNDIAEI